MFGSESNSRLGMVTGALRGSGIDCVGPKRDRQGSTGQAESEQ